MISELWIPAVSFLAGCVRLGMTEVVAFKVEARGGLSVAWTSTKKDFFSVQIYWSGVSIIHPFPNYFLHFICSKPPMSWGVLLLMPPSDRCRIRHRDGGADLVTIHCLADLWRNWAVSRLRTIFFFTWPLHVSRISPAPPTAIIPEHRIPCGHYCHQMICVYRE